MEITVKQGNLQVIKTGTVLVVNNEETVITLDQSFNIKLNYTDDTVDKKQGLFAEPVKNGIIIKLKNFNNPFVKGEDKVFISLSVVAMPVKAKLLTYGIYLEKKDNSDGGNKEH